ncbi:hypothetical protein HBN99_06205 [Pseudomonas oryzihabitans]|uniref:hypothetical protein n=1 Tax=Pseudomonas oryzihabitans TaxID=47885 RepID=UPI0014751132|nr:hypothetical protein [Pseudomonas oryzihabitans]NMZ63916.1 hypothetical protein [Pseudomonas oryzihabitans]
MGIYRWYSAALLVVALVTSANAATVTTIVPRKSVQDLLNAANPVLNENPLGYVQAYDSPFQYQQRPYSVPVQQKVTIPSVAIKDAVKGALRQQAAVAVATAAVSAAVAAAGWVIDEAGQPVKKIGDPNSIPGQFYDASGSYGKDGKTACSLAASKWFGGTTGDYRENWPNAGSNSCIFGSGGYVAVDVRQCSAGTTMNYASQKCESGYEEPAGTAPLTDADYDTLTTYIDGQSAKFRADLAKAACQSSLAPERCYKALQDAASFLNSAPSTIQGPTSSSVTTHKNADGTISTTTTNSDTKFKVEVDGDKVSVKPEKTTTTKNPDGSVSETKEEDEDNSVTVQKPGEEEEKDDPLEKEYTFTNPDMPEVPSFYEQKYPDGLKSVWDDNKGRFDNSAFISFMKSFVPSFSGSCPTWGLPMNIMAQASFGYVTFANICYVFDFVKVVIIATAVFTARKIMFGG